MDLLRAGTEAAQQIAAAVAKMVAASKLNKISVYASK